MTALRSLVSIWLGIIVLALAACTNPISGLLVSRGAKEKEIAALRADFAGKMAANRQETEAATKQLLAAKDAQMVGAATAFYGQDVVFRSILSPTRTDLINHNLSKEGWEALGRVQPSFEAMQKMNERLAAELDATRTSLADLQRNHEQALAQNQALAAATKAFEAKIAAIEARTREMEKAHAAALDRATGELLAVQNQVIAAEKQRADDRAALQALKTKFSVILGVAALAGIAAAIYLPVYRQECGIFGAVCALAAYGIWLIQPWHVGAILGAVVLGIVGWMVFKHQREERAATGVYRAIQAVKDKSRETYDAVVKPQLDQWVTVYDKNGKTRPDLVAEKHIDQRLMEVGDK